MAAYWLKLFETPLSNLWADHRDQEHIPLLIPQSKGCHLVLH
jgi:hypothetical protein